MSGVTGKVKNDMVKTAIEKLKWVGAAIYSAEKGELTQLNTKVLKLPAGHGFAVKDILLIKSITGGTGLVVGRPYFVTKITGTEEIEVSQMEGGPIEEWTTTVTAGKVVKVSEVTGGEYKRIATNFPPTPEKGKDEDVTAHLIPIPAGTNVAALLYWETETVGECKALSELAAPEKFEAAGKLEVKATSTDDLVAP